MSPVTKNICQFIANSCGVDVSQVCSGEKSANVAKARHTFWLALRGLGWSFRDIGIQTGHEHCSVMYGVRRVERDPGSRILAKIVKEAYKEDNETALLRVDAERLPVEERAWRKAEAAVTTLKPEYHPSAFADVAVKGVGYRCNFNATMSPSGWVWTRAKLEAREGKR